MEENAYKTISIRTIQKIENNPKFLCSTNMIDKLAKVFDVSIDELLNKKLNSEILLIGSKKTSHGIQNRSKEADYGGGNHFAGGTELYARPKLRKGALPCND